MPYEIKADGDNYQVVNTDTGAVKATHQPPDAKQKAEKQVHLLEGLEHGWEPGNGD